jgi:hypothetical protein
MLHSPVSDEPYSPVKLHGTEPAAVLGRTWLAAALQRCRLQAVAHAFDTPPAQPGLCTWIQESVKILLAGLLVGGAVGASPPLRCDQIKSFIWSSSYQCARVV